jgi:hypothetical protein
MGHPAKLGYILMHQESCSLFGIKNENINIISHVRKEDNMSVISAHDPIYFELKVTVNPSQEIKKKPVVKSVQLNNMTVVWEPADIELYQVETIFEENFQFLNQPQCIQILALLIPEAYILHKAVEVAVFSKQKRTSISKL